LKFQNKKAAAFGCYGWSGEATKVLSEKLKEAGFLLLNDGIREKWNPDGEAIENSIRFGNEIANTLR
jgi:anaerobic nitric oxide reductase flavorubredoxin